MGQVEQIGPVLSRVTSVSRGQFHQVAFADWGKSEASPVLCLHGLTRQGRDFDFLARELVAQGRRVICPDLVGRGLSDWLIDPKDYDVEQYTTDMVVLLAKLGIDQVDWVGTSLGGLIGMPIAGRKNSPIRRLVINDAGPHLNPAAVFRIVRYVVDAPSSFRSLEVVETYFRNILAPFGQLSDDQWRHLSEHSVHPDREGGFELHYDRRLTKAFRLPWTYEAEFWTAWDNIRCPVLVLRGAESDLLLPRTAHEMAARNSQARIVEIPGAGHAPALANDAQIDLVTSWLT